MRFLSYFLLFIVAVSVPSAIRAQHHDNALHISAVHLPFMIADANTITHTTDDDNNNQNTLQSGTLIAPTLVYSQADHDDSPIVSSLTSPMLIAVDAEGEAEGDEDGLEGESLMIDYQNDDRNTIELFSGINEELQENGAESLLESMDTEDMMIASQGDDDDDNSDDDIDSFHIAAAEGESSADGISKSEAESHLEKERKLEKARRPYRSLRRGFLRRAKGLRRFAPSRRIRERRPGGKRLQRMLKLMVLSKRLKALDMKMNLMKLLSRAIQMRLMEKGMGRGLGMMRAGRGMLMLRSLRNRMIKRLMVLKMIKLMHLLYQSTLGLPVYHRSGFRLSPRFLLRHILRHAYRHPTLARILMGLRLKSLIMRSFMKSFLNNLKFLLKKVYLLKKKGMMAAGNQHRLFVKADRAIVNVGDGNEFKPVFYRSRAAPRVSIDDSNIPLRLTVPAPGIIRRVFTGRTEQERRSDY